MITITAKWVDNPNQRWSGWIAWIKPQGETAYFMGASHLSFCDAINTASNVLRSANPAERITVRDPSDVQKRKADSLPLSGWEALRRQSDAARIRP